MLHHVALSGRVRESILRNTPRNRLSCERLVFLELVEEDGACEVGEHLPLGASVESEELKLVT